MSKKSGKSSRKVARRPKVPRDLSRQSITLHRRGVFSVPKPAADGGATAVVELSSLNASDILSLFSEYRILSVTSTYQLVNAPNNNASFPRLHIAPRGFSNTSPLNRAEVLQYNGVKMYQFGPANIATKYTHIPYVWLDAVGTSTGKQIVRSPWLATDSDTVKHNFAVNWIDRYNSTSDPTHTLEVILDVVLEARGPR
jgi:hypothetical protein